MSWASGGGGAPNPNLPLGAGTAPFFSNLAILSFSAEPPAAVTPVAGDGEVDRSAAFFCSSAAILSFKLVTGITGFVVDL